MKKYFIYSILALLSFYSCSEDEIDAYDINKEKPYFYFQRNSGTQYNSNMTIVIKKNFSDSTNLNFAGSKIEVQDTIVACPIKLLGNTLDKPLKLKFKINNELTTAVLGEDFEINMDTIYLNPGGVRASLRVKLLRTSKLLRKTLCVAIDLLETEDYFVIEKNNNTDVWNNFTQVISGKTYRIFFEERATEPSYYSSFGSSYFGTWTAEKYMILNSIMDWSISDWSNAGSSGAKVALGVFPYAAYQLRDYLQTQADDPINKPVREADGSLMQLPGIYAVDYSRYE